MYAVRSTTSRYIFLFENTAPTQACSIPGFTPVPAFFNFYRQRHYSIKQILICYSASYLISINPNRSQEHHKHQHRAQAPLSQPRMPSRRIPKSNLTLDGRNFTLFFTPPPSCYFAPPSSAAMMSQSLRASVSAGRLNVQYCSDGEQSC